MKTKIVPIIEQWYKELDSEQCFKVVALESADNTIEVQYYDGELGEYEQDIWDNSHFELIEGPEDWSASYGNIEEEDMGYSDADIHRPSIDDIDLQSYDD